MRSLPLTEQELAEFEIDRSFPIQVRRTSYLTRASELCQIEADVHREGIASLLQPPTVDLGHC